MGAFSNYIKALNELGDGSVPNYPMPSRYDSEPSQSQHVPLEMPYPNNLNPNYISHLGHGNAHPSLINKDYRLHAPQIGDKVEIHVGNSRIHRGVVIDVAGVVPGNMTRVKMDNGIRIINFNEKAKEGHLAIVGEDGQIGNTYQPKRVGAKKTYFLNLAPNELNDYPGYHKDNIKPTV